MKTERPRPTRAKPRVLCLILAPALALSFSTAGFSQPETPQIPLSKQQEFIELTGRQVPYAARAAAFLEALAHMQQFDQEDGGSRTSAILSTLGFEPDSVNARELCEVALAMDQSMAPYGPETFQSLEGQDLIAAQRERQLTRFGLAGQGLGAWLRNSATRGSAVDPLLERLLDSPYIAVSIGTTDPEFDFSALTANKRAFEQGLKETLGYVPDRMSHGSEEDQ